MKPKVKKRCAWVTDAPIYISYHDLEWGLPIYDDRLLFEFLVLEGMQAGLSWLTILKKRDNYRKSFDNFNAEKIVKYDQQKINELLMNEGIIRNKLKIASVITNAQSFLRVTQEFSSFSEYIWGFVNGRPIQNRWQNITEVPSTSAISDQLSKDLKKRGFKFVGSTICYAFMQAVGMINDHTADCFLYNLRK
ncbi:MAG TPA: DNA-3-methyladenine glycosylase I [Gammaproteobacteria bacterium]|nr:DNA-3-methyladenine glycosylase I [Gammaproteobacteria bacterium]